MGSGSGDSRMHKIRIVEKLLTSSSSSSSTRGTGGVMAAAMSSGREAVMGNGLFPPGGASSLMPSQSDDGWLDDSTLSTLSTSDLEKLMDQFLVRVVQQLVHFATMDDDLKAELDHLDPWYAP
jgi:hypothetical protein